MHPVSGGFVTHRIKGDGDYKAQKAAALSQSKKNEFIQGVQSTFLEGAGEPIKESRTQYGNVNVMPQEVLQGEFSNFQQKESVANKPLEDPLNQTGSVELEQSATRNVSEDPEGFETSALEERLAMMAKGGMSNLNNISSLYKLGG
jgi:hypothetical protein